MSGIQVSPEAVEAARTGNWLTSSERAVSKDRATDAMREALEAAAPILYREWSEKLLGEESVEAVAQALNRVSLYQTHPGVAEQRKRARKYLQAALAAAAFPDQEEGS